MEKNFNKILILLGYGLVTFFALFVNHILIENLFPKTFNENKWTIGKEFMWTVWIIFSIGLSNAFYTSYSNHEYFQYNIRFFLIFQGFTLVIGILPVTILIIAKQKYLLKTHLNSADALNKAINQDKSSSNNIQSIRFYADNEKDFIEFDINDFCFIESSGNYIEISLFKDNKLIRKTFRSTLKRSVKFFINTPEIIQCHRAFIVNTNKIVSVKGNSQGLRLSLKNCDLEVPVSRGFVNMVQDKINSGNSTSNEL